MRIIAGKYRSRLINMPKRPLIRPTKDRVREALFNILGERVIDSVVLDAFSGSGAFGLEALSRGAKRVAFVEIEAKCCKVISENLADLGIERSSYDVFKMDALNSSRILKKTGYLFDIVLLDPPYYKNLVKKCLIKLDDRDILSQVCIIVAEHHKKDDISGELENVILYRKQHYGDICLSFFKMK